MSNNFHSLCAAVVAAILSIASPQSGGDQDSVELKSGGVIDGVIVDESPTWVTVEVSAGARIEVARTDIIHIKRGARKTASAPASKPAFDSQRFDESWWTVSGIRGESIGTLHRLARRDRERPELYNLEEILEFTDDDGKNCIVSRIEMFDSAMNPVECQYREVFEGGSSHVRATVAGAQLEVETMDSVGRSREQMPFPKGTLFPLMFEMRALEARLATGQKFECEVFDPFARNIIKKTVRAEAPRRIATENETPVLHSILIFKNRGTDSVYWIGRNGELARRELNGPDLIATKTTQALAQSARGAATNASWVARDSSGRLRVLLPGVEWEVDRLADGAISVRRKDGIASVAACVMDAEAGATLTSNGVDLERRLKMSLADFKRTGEHELFQIGNVAAAKFRFQYSQDNHDRIGIAVITTIKEKLITLTLSAEPRELERVEADFDRMVTRADVAF